MGIGTGYAGVDLAADAKRTGIARLRDDGDRGVIDDVHVGVDDDTIIDAVVSDRRTGVDVPFGWPRAFIDLVVGHRARALAAPPDTGIEWRRSVLYRASDLEVARRVGRAPLSVAADKIAHPAVRWTGIVARLEEQGLTIPPDGRGAACEVYPAAALHVWGLAGLPYKGRKNTSARAVLIDRLSSRAPWLTWGEHRRTCIDDDNALDAVIAALVARAVDQGRAVPPSPELDSLAAEEGWIWLPDSSDPPGPAPGTP